MPLTGTECRFYEKARRDWPRRAWQADRDLLCVAAQQIPGVRRCRVDR